MQFKAMIVGLAIILPLRAGTAGASPALPQSFESRSVSDVQADLTRLLDCRWSGNETDIDCISEKLSGTISLTRSASADRVETIEFMALGPRDPKAKPNEAAVVAKIMSHLFPAWAQAGIWTEQAVRDVFKGKGTHTKKLGGETILIQAHHFADIDGDFADIVITSKPSIDEFLEP